MLFTTWTFALLLLTTLVLFFLPFGEKSRGERQILVLFLSSLIFYSYEKPVLVVLLLFSILANSWHVIRIIRIQSAGGNPIRWVQSAVFINLLLLGFFKYAGFLARAVLPEGFAPGLVAQLSSIPLPVGISFFTFQAISLVIDLHRGDSGRMTGLTELVNKNQHVRSTMQIGFFIAFFPQLVAGPIVKARDFFYQIEEKFSRSIQWELAIKSLIGGLFLKMVVADNLKEVTVLLEQDTHVHRLDLIALIYGYSCQIFADFAGYSLIAIGLAGLFGYRLPINFNFPYIASSITDFWKRWHISLSTWLKEYLYIPLGGNRRGEVRTYVNLFLVMLLGGLWHGAAWNYVIWGGAHGLFLAFERYFGHQVKFSQRGIGRVIRSLIVFHLVSALWLLFLLPDFNSVVLLGRDFATGAWRISPQIFFTVFVFGSPILFYHLYQVLIGIRPEFRARLSPNIVWWGYAALLFLIITNSGSTGAFVYFQF